MHSPQGRAIGNSAMQPTGSGLCGSMGHWGVDGVWWYPVAEFGPSGTDFQIQMDIMLDSSQAGFDTAKLTVQC